MATDPQVIEATKLMTKTAVVYLSIFVIVGGFVAIIFGLVVRYLENKVEYLGKILRNKSKKKKKV